ncbi:MAG TPA: hypothetical protein VKA81_05660 [Verrucomicrobiae bacterium]|nr:hypothetical protein [Verrucomicrobiae bacterium]
MNPRVRAALQIGLLLAVIAVLFLVFPRAYAFVEMAARELRYLWWLILLIALAIWLIWGIKRKPK